MNNLKLNELGGVIVDSAVTVHKELGPGLLESVYQHCMVQELELRSICVLQKIAVPLFYKQINTGKYLEIDILVEGEIILELKAIETILPVHTAQLLTYLKLSNKKLGYLLNFNVPIMKEGIKRLVNQL